MKVLVDIPDKDANFAMKVLRSLTFVKNATPLGSTKAELTKDLKEAAQEVRMHKEGKFELKSAQELLSEL